MTRSNDDMLARQLRQLRDTVEDLKRHTHPDVNRGRPQPVAAGGFDWAAAFAHPPIAGTTYTLSGFATLAFSEFVDGTELTAGSGGILVPVGTYFVSGGFQVTAIANGSTIFASIMHDGNGFNGAGFGQYTTTITGSPVTAYVSASGILATAEPATISLSAQIYTDTQVDLSSIRLFAMKLSDATVPGWDGAP